MVLLLVSLRQEMQQQLLLLLLLLYCNWRPNPGCRPAWHLGMPG
jgi:hypothetical protein